MAIEITIQKDDENPFLERREVKFIAVSDGATPTCNEVRAALASKLKVPDKNIMVEHVYQKMGLHESECIANIYKKAVLGEEKEEGKEGEPAESAPPEEKKADAGAEKPAEEKEAKKEEKKAESPDAKEKAEENKENTSDA